MQHKFTTRFVFGMVALSLFVSPFFVLALPARAEGIPDSHWKNFGLEGAAVESGLKRQGAKEGTATTVQTAIGQIIGLALSFVGVIFLLMMIVGGFMWMTAGGNEDQTGKAKKILTSAIIGLVLIFAAYAITAFVTGTLGTAFGTG